MSKKRLPHWITFQKQTFTKDPDTKENIPTWVDYVSTFANIEPLRGKMLLQAKEVNTELTTTITLRYRPGIEAGMRAVYKGRVFEIPYPPINEGEQDRYLVLICTERTPTHPRK